MNKMVRMAVCHPGSHLLITHNQNNFQRESPRYDKALAEFLDTIKVLTSIILIMLQGIGNDYAIRRNNRLFLHRSHKYNLK